MKLKNKALDAFNSFPDELLIHIAQNDFEALEELCMALTLDIHLLKQKSKKSNKKD
jgi:hypothetical protein